jgi:hypothetical protein
MEPFQPSASSGTLDADAGRLLFSAAGASPKTPTSGLSTVLKCSFGPQKHRGPNENDYDTRADRKLPAMPQFFSGRNWTCAGVEQYKRGKSAIMHCFCEWLQKQRFVCDYKGLPIFLLTIYSLSCSFSKRLNEQFARVPFEDHFSWYLDLLRLYYFPSSITPMLPKT